MRARAPGSRRMLRRIAIAAVCAYAVALGAGVAVASPAVWFVAPGGSDGTACDAAQPCATINGAIGKSSAGDTIRVAVGTYAQAVVLDRSVTLEGGYDGGSRTG